MIQGHNKCSTTAPAFRIRRHSRMRWSKGQIHLKVMQFLPCIRPDSNATPSKELVWNFDILRPQVLANVLPEPVIGARCIVGAVEMIV